MTYAYVATLINVSPNTVQHIKKIGTIAAASWCNEMPHPRNPIPQKRNVKTMLTRRNYCQLIPEEGWGGTSGSYIPLFRRAMNLHNRSLSGPAMNPSNDAIRAPIPISPIFSTGKLYGGDPKIRENTPANTESHALLNPVINAYMTCGNKSKGKGRNIILKRFSSDSIPRQGRNRSKIVNGASDSFSGISFFELFPSG